MLSFPLDGTDPALGEIILEKQRSWIITLSGKYWRQKAWKDIFGNGRKCALPDSCDAWNSHRQLGLELVAKPLWKLLARASPWKMEVAGAINCTSSQSKFGDRNHFVKDAFVGEASIGCIYHGMLAHLFTRHIKLKRSWPLVIHLLHFFPINGWVPMMTPDPICGYGPSLKA